MEVTHKMIKAAAESRARDDEGQFEPLCDLIGFSGENKTRTVIREALECAIAAADVDDLHRPRPFCDWHEDLGDVLWWRMPIEEAPYVGSPLDHGRIAEGTINFPKKVGNAWPFSAPYGGWPFDETDERHLWWTPLPDAAVIDSQIPL